MPTFLIPAKICTDFVAVQGAFPRNFLFILQYLTGSLDIAIAFNHSLRYQIVLKPH